jgi:hypothetical protein
MDEHSTLWHLGWHPWRIPRWAFYLVVANYHGLIAKFLRWRLRRDLRRFGTFWS